MVGSIVGHPVRTIVLAVLACSLAAMTMVSLASPQAPPETVVNTLSELKKHFAGMSDPDHPGTMEHQVTRNDAAIQTILAYARQSREAGDGLAQYLLAEIDAFNARYRRGTVIPEEVVSKREWKRGEIPWEGIRVDAYLLLSLAEENGSATLTKRVLTTLRDYGAACSNLFEQITIRTEPELLAEVEREKQETGGWRATPIAEVAWPCERFMVRAYLSDRFASAPDSARVVSEYWQWRKETMIAEGQGEWLPTRYQHRTLEYVGRLGETLPEK